MTREVSLLLGASAVMHLLVDGICLCCLYLTVASPNAENILAVFLLYNVLAFLSQPLTGLIADRLTHRHWLLLLSVGFLALGVLVSLSLPLWQLSLMPVAALLGIGNSLFHVWGGKQVALTTGNDIRALGVFVSTGAMGLAVGMVLFSWMLLSLFLIALCVLAAFYLHIDARAASLAHLSDDQNARSFSQMFILLSVLALMGVVALRSHLGTAFSSPFGRTTDVVLLIGLVSMLGKMSGGWLVHLLGMVPAVGVMLLAVVGCLLFRHAGHYVLLLGLLAVNLTMPVTLYFANVVLKGHEGLAFGLLAAALVPSYLLLL